VTLVNMVHLSLAVLARIAYLRCTPAPLTLHHDVAVTQRQAHNRPESRCDLETASALASYACAHGDADGQSSHTRMGVETGEASKALSKEVRDSFARYLGGPKQVPDAMLRSHKSKPLASLTFWHVRCIDSKQQSPGEESPETAQALRTGSTSVSKRAVPPLRTRGRRRADAGRGG
jgi:hypothetical protein